MTAAALLTALTTALSGCASTTPQAGIAPVSQLARQHLGQDVQVQWGRTAEERGAMADRVGTLLDQPLSAASAVQVALLNNRGLQARLAELGIGRAELEQAGRLPNPGFSFGRTTRGDEREIERGLHLNLARLLALPMIQAAESRRFAQSQGRATMAVLTLAANTRKAYYVAVAAEETVRYMQQVQRAAQASAELARRMQAVGNFNKLQRAREQAFQADAQLNLARAEQAALAARERLTRLLGLWGAQRAFRLPERLPDLPEAPIDQPDIERLAMAQRLDVQGAKLMAEQTAKNLGLTQTTRFVNVLELGVLRNSSNEAPTQSGWQISVELPLFDWGDAKVARAEAVYLQALDQAAETAVNARSEVRQAYGAYRSAYDIARFHRDELMPLRRLIQEENVLRYNGMLIGVFELLADVRLQIASVNNAIEALRDFWLAQADLDMALVGQPSLGSAAAPAMAAGEAAGAGH